MTNQYTKPAVIISSLDAERLESLIESLPNNAFPGKGELEAELARADVVEPEDVPATVVTMNSTVRFQVDSSLEEFSLTLVYPKDMDTSGGKISILAPEWHLPCKPPFRCPNTQIYPFVPVPLWSGLVLPTRPDPIHFGCH